MDGGDMGVASDCRIGRMGSDQDMLICPDWDALIIAHQGFLPRLDCADFRLYHQNHFFFQIKIST
jgi:hypothetical protein